MDHPASLFRGLHADDGSSPLRHCRDDDSGDEADGALRLLAQVLEERTRRMDLSARFDGERFADTFDPGVVKAFHTLSRRVGVHDLHEMVDPIDPWRDTTGPEDDGETAPPALPRRTA